MRGAELGAASRRVALLRVAFLGFFVLLAARAAHLTVVTTRGEIRVDSGAASALRTRNSSLLPVGVRDVGGNFNRRDVVMIVDDEGKKVAFGITNYSSEEIAAIKGLRSDRIEETLGHRYGEEVVHRNNLAVL